MAKNIYKYETKKQPILLELDIQVDVPCPLLIKGFDGMNVNTTYFEKGFHSDKVVKGTVKYMFPMPLTPEILFVSITNKKTGDSKGIKVVNATRFTLKTDEFVSRNKKLQDFVRFWIPFCEKAGYLPTGDYSMPDKEIFVKYSPYIKDLRTGGELKTPARVFRKGNEQYGKRVGEMEFSRNHFIRMTIPMRIMSGLHEAGHYFLDTSDEFECDKFAYNIYRQLGFSKNEAITAMTKIFMPFEMSNGVSEKWKNEMNNRTKKMYKYINNRA
jgi:hypothetical protein